MVDMIFENTANNSSAFISIVIFVEKQNGSDSRSCLPTTIFWCVPVYSASSLASRLIALMSATYTHNSRSPHLSSLFMTFPLFFFISAFGTIVFCFLDLGGGGGGGLFVWFFFFGGGGVWSTGVVR